jgi:general secretion pathway protein A
MRSKPFSIAVDPEVFFRSPSHNKALETIAYGVSQRKGLVVVIGEAGLGKTVLLRTFIRDHRSAGLKILGLPNSEACSAEQIKALFREGSAPVQLEDAGSSFRQLQRALTRDYEEGQRVVLLVDDAQDLPGEALQQIHMLSNLEVRSEKLLQIVLLGRPELWRILERPELRQVRQRIAMVVTLAPLNGEESRSYIQFRLEKAGMRDRSLFTDGALKYIVRLAGGVPRKINILCHQALKMGHGQPQQPVTKKIVKEMAEDLGYSDRTKWKPWGLPSATGALVLVGFLFLGAHYRSLGQKAETLLTSLSGPSSAGPVAVGRVSEEGVSEAVTLVPSSRPAVAKGRPGPTLETPNPLPPFLENEIVQSDARTGSKTRSSEKIRWPDEERPQEIPQRSVSRNRASLPLTRVVREGDNFFRLVLDIYGTSNRVLWDHVRQHNPGIKEINRIRVGDKIVFPDWKALADSKEKTRERTAVPPVREQEQMPEASENRS